MENEKRNCREARRKRENNLILKIGKIPKYPLNLCPKSQRHTYTILRFYYPPELILYVIFYPFLAYVALVRKKSQPSLGPQDSAT